MFDDNETSAFAGISTGAKIAILAAIPFIALGVYFLITPITELRTTTGSVFGCGTAIGAPDDQFRASICGPINTMYMYRGIASIVAGLGIGALGFFFFNASKDGSASEKSPSNSSKSPRSFD